MADSPEHKFISASLDRALKKYSETRLLGLKEAKRRTFDYGCIILRDASRPLVSQVLWSHEEGIEKDLRTLLFDGGASLKIYFVRDRIRSRAKIDEVLEAYRGNLETRSLLRGLRIIPVPEDFDAGSELDRDWLERYILDRASSDLLFGVVFGKLSASDVQIFSRHGGPFGLKMAALHVIASSGLNHGPTFQAEIGYKGPPLREVITMLTGIGFITAPDPSIIRVPTIKGRFLLDFGRRLVFERQTLNAWSPELQVVMQHLGLDPVDVWKRDLDEIGRSSTIVELLRAIEYARSQFGIDVMSTVNFTDPVFYSELPILYFTQPSFYSVRPEIWNDPDDIVRFGDDSAMRG
jgi:hypothetical protein